MDEKLINIAIEKMKTISDPEHYIGHTLDVVDYANELMIEIPARRDVVIIACYWHDVGRTVCQVGHEEMSGKLLRQQMEEMGYKKEKIDACCNAVIYHKWNAKPITVEGNIVRDSDKLGFLGKRRWYHSIECNYKLSSIIESIPKLRNQYLFFNESRIIYDRDIKLVNYLIKETNW